MRLAQAFCLCSAIMCASFDAAATQRPNIQVRACLAWDARLQMMLEFSERYGIHDAGLRHMVQTEVRSLKPRCIRDIGQSSLNRYVLLTKLLHDDEADEVEMFE